MNTFGNTFRVTTFGESHGPAIGCIIDGCPSNIEISVEEIQKELDRRRPGQSKVSTPRDEADHVEILSGVFEGKTLGTPIALLIRNKDQRSKDYSNIKDIFRPGHADFTWEEKFGHRDYRGGGRSSARETAARVAAGAIAKKVLKEKCGMEIIAYTEQIYDIAIENTLEVEDISALQKMAEDNIVRCPDKETAKKMINRIEEMKKEGNSVGGLIQCLIQNAPVGLGEPVFDKLPALLAHAMMSINAAKGFEIGSGFGSVIMTGAEHNDEFYMEDGKVRTKSNHAGGTLGGISTGELIDFRVAFKPTATIIQEQKSVDKNGNEVKFTANGRHDPCVVPRAVPIVEAMAALVMADLYLRT